MPPAGPYTAPREGVARVSPLESQLRVILKTFRAFWSASNLYISNLQKTTAEKERIESDLRIATFPFFSPSCPETGFRSFFSHKSCIILIYDKKTNL